MPRLPHVAHERSDSYMKDRTVGSRSRAPEAAIARHIVVAGVAGLVASGRTSPEACLGVSAVKTSFYAILNR